LNLVDKGQHSLSFDLGYSKICLLPNCTMLLYNDVSVEWLQRATNFMLIKLNFKDIFKLDTGNVLTIVLMKDIQYVEKSLKQNLSFDFTCNYNLNEATSI